ncbi:MAG TPA: hypothetical protein VHN78_08815, partial [Chloroflexota bacterium]|nr:hypothetical protein [Chloroflexota bacterium]
RYDVWTFAASHATPDVEPMFFALRQVAGPELEGRAAPPALLYATDTGPFPAETWAALERLGAEGLRFNAAALDSTLGAGADGNAHMSLKQVERHYQELERRGLLAPQARRFAHHFSHGNTPPHEELTEALSPAGIEPSYDGLSLML